MFGSGEVLLVYDGTFSLSLSLDSFLIPLSIFSFTYEILYGFLDLGCYLNTKGEPMHGRPGRESGYLRWESKATSYITRGPLLLLFSPKYIEIRTINEGELVQVIEGEDIRLVHGGERGIYIARKGVERTGGGAGGVEVLVELVETKPIEDVKPASEPPVVDQDGVLWEEWDM